MDHAQDRAVVCRSVEHTTAGVLQLRFRCAARSAFLTKDRTRRCTSMKQYCVLSAREQCETVLAAHSIPFPSGAPLHLLPPFSFSFAFTPPPCHHRHHLLSYPDHCSCIATHIANNTSAELAAAAVVAVLAINCVLSYIKLDSKGKAVVITGCDTVRSTE